MTTLSSLPTSDLTESVAAACQRIPPLWPLQSFVAVNPFLGLSDRSFADACALMGRVTRGGMLMPAAYYRAQGAAGVEDADLEGALAQSDAAFSVAELRQWLGHAALPAAPAIPTVSEALDAFRGTRWTAFVVDEISKWCSAFYDEGQASWRMPWRGLPLFEAWRRAAWDDANPEVMGLRGFRAFVRGLPENPSDTIDAALAKLYVAPDECADFLHRQLLSIGGWSAYAQYLAREKGMRGQSDESLEALLAIRLAHDWALHEFAGDEFWRHWSELLEATRDQPSEPTSPAYVWQLAAELAHQRRLVAALRQARTRQTRDDLVRQTLDRETLDRETLDRETLDRETLDPESFDRSTPVRHKIAATGARAEVQAAFCIDVRSEVFRRHLEAASSGIETIGFAGFFGFAIEYVPFGAARGNAQCPVLLLPAHRIEAVVEGASPDRNARLLGEKQFAQGLARAWNSFKTSAISCFAFVETGGFLAGAKLVKDTCALPHADHRAPTKPCADGIALEERIATATGALRGMGLTRDFARLVLICGHGSHTTNNPYAAGLDCGACGGHSGEANARVAVAVFNDPRVRQGLAEAGIVIPDDTYFVAGLHNTTTDDVTLFDAPDAPATHIEELQSLRNHLALAGKNSRAERAASLGLAPGAADVDKDVRARSHDWAQTRPEWGLAGNAAFIAAPRARTAPLNLGGRAFLHNYDYRSDPEGAILEVIMTAPMVVASWINLQYFASTANNAQWGSGNKVIHNVVGTLGVWEGNAGDLQVGLPLQSVHDGHKFVHEPLRLSVFLEAPRAMIERVIAAQSGVRDLVDNGWVLPIAIEDEGRSFWRYRGEARWEEI